MNKELYIQLNKKINDMNKINNEISFLEWNNEDGIKFSSIKEMKEFESRLKNNELDYLFESDTELTDIRNIIIEEFNYTIENFDFYIYTYQNKSDLNYITYLSIKNLEDDNVIDKLCGNSTISKIKAHEYFKIIKENITTNTLEDLLENLIIEIDKKVLELKTKLSKLTSEY